MFRLNLKPPKTLFGRWNTLSDVRLVLLCALWLTLLYNYAFFRNITDIYPLSLNSALFIFSLTALLNCFIALLLLSISWRPIFKPALAILFIVSSITAYFMDTYNVIIDHNMIQNAVTTNTAEATDLFSFKLLMYFLLLGVLPTALLYFHQHQHVPIKHHVISKTKLTAILLSIIIGQMLIFGKSNASFFREHKSLRYYSNPTTLLYSGSKYINSQFANQGRPLIVLGADAKKTGTARELFILVVGETARADHFSLNGYPRKTNPLLEKESIINFPHVSSCGTTTAVSVPCIFALAKRENYNDYDAQTTENLLDVLAHAGTHILWRDNNSDSKGVAVRVTYEDYKTDDRNTICDIECRDEGMLPGLQEYINAQKDGDILIVLHQMGNHGPAYYKRYPESFAQFKPICTTNELASCTEQEITNAYDNAILYTDYFLSKVIALLKQNNQHFKTGMLYISDHGESLGEKGLFLHGMPYFIAPETQTHVGAIAWLGDKNSSDNIAAIKSRADSAFSHDNIFHTVLGFMGIETSIYEKDLDIFRAGYDIATQAENQP